MRSSDLSLPDDDDLVTYIYICSNENVGGIYLAHTLEQGSLCGLRDVDINLSRKGRTKYILSR